MTQKQGTGKQGFRTASDHTENPISNIRQRELNLRQRECVTGDSKTGYWGKLDSLGAALVEPCLQELRAVGARA